MLLTHLLCFNLYNILQTKSIIRNITEIVEITSTTKCAMIRSVLSFLLAPLSRADKIKAFELMAYSKNGCALTFRKAISNFLLWRKNGVWKERRDSNRNQPDDPSTTKVQLKQLLGFYWPLLSNLLWMRNSVSIGLGTAMKTGSSRRLKWYLTIYMWVSS